jgi:hypothetical protein
LPQKAQNEIAFHVGHRGLQKTIVDVAVNIGALLPVHRTRGAGGHEVKGADHFEIGNPTQNFFNK